jgi:hypothetical protein
MSRGTESHKCLDVDLPSPCATFASGDSYKSLMYGFRIEEYADEVMSTPTTEEWKVLADQFGTRWKFHHAVRAMDGKHIAIKCPRNGGSLCYNYKGFHSIVLLALVDADYKFMWIDAGSNGSASDAQIFNGCELKAAIQDNTVGFPT